jgi:mutator protein MutT
LRALAGYNRPVDTPVTHFTQCPRCGVRQPAAPDPVGPFRCVACGFTLYFNAASAVAAILVRDDGRALFIRRAKEPGKGKLGMPGGFVDPGETAEEALTREVREEVGLEVNALEYLSSHANQYPYSGVTYTTLDLFYTASVKDPQRAAALDAVESLVWADPRTVDLDQIAFDSMRQALERYRRLVRG